jgi:hypothetical protein
MIAVCWASRLAAASSGPAISRPSRMARLPVQAFSSATAEVTSTATSIDRLLACTVVSWPTEEGINASSRSWLGIIVVFASLRRAALVGWSKA